jgi:hyaluronan synthase
MAIPPAQREHARRNGDACATDHHVRPVPGPPPPEPVLDLDLGLGLDGPTVILDPEAPRSPSSAEGGLPGPLAWVARVGVVAYMALVLGFIWLARDLTLATFTEDPIFAGYSIAVVTYVLGRFTIALFYRPKKDRGHRPSVSIIIPAFNEQEGIIGTIQSCLAVDYPADKLEVVAVNDGSTDATWENILEAKRRWPQLHAVDLGRNHGKRGAMAEGVRRSSGEILCFVDSDSYLEADSVVNIVAPLADERVGAVVGHAEVRNRLNTFMTKMQQVRYYAAFRIMKGAESVLSGTVTCASGCFAAYRRSVVEPLVDAWEFQTFLGRPATFGDDRALTNRILENHRVVYQSNARCETVVPESPERFLRQQLRWKKSWLRESLYLAKYFWRKNPLAALFTYASIVFPFLAPWVVLHAVAGRLLFEDGGGLWFYLIGTYAMAVLYSLVYAFRRPGGLWFHGMTFIVIYMTVLVFQTYWGILTMRDTRWGTRNATVTHDRIDPDAVTALPPGGPPDPGYADRPEPAVGPHLTPQFA